MFSPSAIYARGTNDHGRAFPSGQRDRTCVVPRDWGMQQRERTTPVSTNRIKGAAKEVAGSLKEVAGKAGGNDRLRVKGAAEKAVGKAQNALGKAQDNLGNALKR